MTLRADVGVDRSRSGVQEPLLQKEIPEPCHRTGIAPLTCLCVEALKRWSEVTVPVYACCCSLLW